MEKGMRVGIPPPTRVPHRHRIADDLRSTKYPITYYRITAISIAIPNTGSSGTEYGTRVLPGTAFSAWAIRVAVSGRYKSWEIFYTSRVSELQGRTVRILSGLGRAWGDRGQTQTSRCSQLLEGSKEKRDSSPPIPSK
eukprot:849813-Rhodomonas_salina.1